jgi:protein ImuA
MPTVDLTSSLPSPRESPLESLRDRLAQQASKQVPERRAKSAASSVVSLGLTAVDQALGGVLRPGTLHEIAPDGIGSLGAAHGFMAGLLCRTCASRPAVNAHLLYIQQWFSANETGELYAPGLSHLGLHPRRLTLLRVRAVDDVLWAMEEALKCRSLVAVVAEMGPSSRPLDLTASRRLVLAAEAGGTLGLMMLPRPSPSPSAATTRWVIKAMPNLRSPSDRASSGGRLDQPTFQATLTRNRAGLTGTWPLTWSARDAAFANAARTDVGLDVNPRDTRPQTIRSSA